MRAEAPHYSKPAARGVLWFLLSSTIALGSTLAVDEWPEFRGPTGQGHSNATGLPLEWSPTKNVAWKTAVPGTGWSSPVVGRGHLILTTGVPAAGGGVSLRVLAFDLSSGRAAWETEVFTAAEAAPQTIHAKNSPASPTPILDGERIYVHFGHHGTAALDRAGKVLWRNRTLGYDPVHGNGGSPALAGDRLIFNADGATAPFVAALDRHTGELRWKIPRAVQPKQTFSFSTPLVITVDGRTQVISPGSGAVAALDPTDGRELWHVRYGSGYSVVPRPVFAHGLLFVGTGYNRADLLAIRAGGTGDATDTHIAWRTTKGAPLTPSLLALGDELYGVDDKGVATCWDARTGTVHWQERLDGNYSASPVAAEGRLYFQNETGTGTVLRASRKFEKLAVNKLEERSLASYAIADGALFVRTAAHLFRLQLPR